MTDAQLDELFADPRFRDRMFQFIQSSLQIKVDVSSEGTRIAVEVGLYGTTDPYNRRRDYLLSDSDSTSIYLD